MPRWLVVLGIAAACTLLVALLRYAIDLLGVVFLIILVGFSIRAVSDWLTEGESVSAWALAAVFAGLFGTVLVGLWLFGSRDMTSGVFEHGLPSPIVSVADWFEAHGWGQRVLLGGGPTAPAMPVTSAPLSASGSGGESSAPRPEPEPASAPPSRASGSEPSSREGKATVRSGAGEAEAATTSPSRPHGSRSHEPPVTVSDTQGQEPAAPPPAAAEAPAAPQPAADSTTSTSTTVSSSHATSTVGTSVRFTATVTGDGAGVPTGIVVFFDGDRPIGMAPVHGAGASVTAVLSTLDLALGDHQITAEFHGTHGFLNSRSGSIAQTVTRR